MTRLLKASLVALSIATCADTAGASTQDQPDPESARAVIQNAPEPDLRDAWKKALVYVALLGAAVYGARLYSDYTDELDGPV